MMRYFFLSFLLFLNISCQSKKISWFDDLNIVCNYDSSQKLQNYKVINCDLKSNTKENLLVQVKRILFKPLSQPVGMVSTDENKNLVIKEINRKKNKSTGSIVSNILNSTSIIALPSTVLPILVNAVTNNFKKSRKSNVEKAEKELINKLLEGEIKVPFTKSVRRNMLLRIYKKKEPSTLILTLAKENDKEEFELYLK